MLRCQVKDLRTGGHFMAPIKHKSKIHVFTYLLIFMYVITYLNL